MIKTCAYVIIFLFITSRLNASRSSRVIIIEDAKACYRRVLSGKRITPSFVKKTVFCESLEDCMKECAEESQFVCEGFNYRYDPVDKIGGECEILDLPLQQINLRRDIIHDPNYDYYERDRDVGPDCRTTTYSRNDRPYYQQNKQKYDDKRRPYYNDRRYSSYDYGGSYLDYDHDYRPLDYEDYGYRYDRPYKPYEEGRRGGKSYKYHHHNYDDYNSSDDRRFLFRPTSRPYWPYKGDSPSLTTTFVPDKPTTSDVTTPSYSTTFKSNPEGDQGKDLLPPPVRFRPRKPPSYLPDSQKGYLPSRNGWTPISDRRGFEPFSPPFTEYHLRNQYWDNYAREREQDWKYWGFDRSDNYWGGSYGNFGRPRVYYNSIPDKKHGDDSNVRNLQRFVPNNNPYGSGLYGYGGEKNYKDSYNYWGMKKLEGHSYLPPEDDYKPVRHFPPPEDDYKPVRHFPPPEDDYKPVRHFPPPEEDYKPVRHFPPPEDDNKPVRHFPPPEDDYKPVRHFPPPEDDYKPVRHFPPSEDDYKPVRHFPPPEDAYKPVRHFPPPNGVFFGGEAKLFANDYLVRKSCSLRMTSGFRLHRHIVRNFLAAKDIYECELLCFNEKSFVCSSYSFRYTHGPSVPPENCYLSDKDYRNIDYYVDLEPDRNFDVYTMNNREICQNILSSKQGYSECFWRVRSGLRFDHKIVKDSLTCQTLPECQLECLHSRRFTCRAFSYRFGPSIFGGSIDNCQLTDLPFFELNPRLDLKPEPGFEVYERGSYGHGCEPFHFKIGSTSRNATADSLNELCYVGYGSPAKILPVATKSSVRVENDLECRRKCTEAREKRTFECMSYSFRLNAPSDISNCDLSDIYQSDLLPNVDYVFDTDSSLYAWNDYDPECVTLISSKGNNLNKHNAISIPPSHGSAYPLDTWRMFSVNGWPCKSVSRQNKEAGFWFCEIDGGSPNSWDYCCKPDHQCGYSEGYPYQWCYVGEQKTQWRKCNEKYYPYAKKIIIRLPSRIPDPYHLPDHKPLYTNLIPNYKKPYNLGFRPDRPLEHRKLPPYKSLNEYEKDFDREFLLERPGNDFGEGKRWPITYLHKEKPPTETISNSTGSEGKTDFNADGKNSTSKYEAISNLIDIIKQEENEMENNKKNETIPQSNMNNNNTRTGKNRRGTYRRSFITKTSKPFTINNNSN